MTVRTWVKINCLQWLDTELAEDPLEVKGAFVMLLAMAGSKRFGFRGEIALLPGCGLGDKAMALLLRISTRKWRRLKAYLVEKDRIMVLPGGVIRIRKWQNYRSEYERQIQHRLMQSAQESAQKGKENEDG